MRKVKDPISTRLLRSKSFIIILVVLVGLVGYGFARKIIQAYEIEREITDLKANIIELETQNFDTSKLIQKLQNQFYIEQEARIKLGLKKPGESVVVIQGDLPASNPKPDEQKIKHENINNPALWWDHFFKEQG